MENGYKLDNYSYCSNSRVYEDFVPTSELVHGKDYNTLLLNLPGFKKEEIKIELCKTGILKISGQRPVNKFLSFEKDIHVSTNCDKSKISAKLLNGILYVKHPKLIIPSEKNENENKLPSSTNNEPRQDKRKPELDELNKQDNAEQDNRKPELDELNKQDNAEQDNRKSELDELNKQDNAEQDNRKPELDELNKQDNAEQDNRKPELDELNKQDNAEQDNRKPELDELNKQDNGELDNKKPELDELNKQDNAEHSPAKQEQPKTHEQTQVVKPDESMKDATTPSASDLAKLKVSRNVMNIALATLVVLGVGSYVVSMMRSSKKAKE